VEGLRPLSVRIANAYIYWVLTACETDAVVSGQIFKVNALVDPPESPATPGVHLPGRDGQSASPERCPSEPASGARDDELSPKLR
jgi:hypothetical protein